MCKCYIKWIAWIWSHRLCRMQGICCMLTITLCREKVHAKPKPLKFLNIDNKNLIRRSSVCYIQWAIFWLDRWRHIKRSQKISNCWRDFIRSEWIHFKEQAVSCFLWEEEINKSNLLITSTLFLFLVLICTLLARTFAPMTLFPLPFVRICWLRTLF